MGKGFPIQIRLPAIPCYYADIPVMCLAVQTGNQPLDP